jgi:hypothetical protein
MKNRLLIVSALATALTLQFGYIRVGTFADKFALAATVQAAGQEQIYGAQLMTPQKRAAFSSKMSAAKTVEEREQLRQENHQAMQERAKSQGMSLPDQPPAGMGQGGGMMNQGSGMGHGSGMGSGQGHNQ